MKKNSRREFLGTLGLTAAGALAATSKSFGVPFYIPELYKPKSMFNGVQVGCITYSFREMPDQSLQATLDYILDCGISAVELMGDPAESFAGAPKNPIRMADIGPIFRKRSQKIELTEEEKKKLEDFDAQRKAFSLEKSAWRKTADISKFEKAGKLFKKAGVKIYAFKPDAFGMNNSDEDIEYGMKAAKAIGSRSVTLEHPANDAHTLKLGKAAEKYGLLVGYHGHEQQTYTFWDTALAQSPANTLNLDLGHFVAAGNPEPLNIIKQKHDRISSMHLKDRQSKAHGGANLPWGTGDTPIVEALKLIRDQKYQFPVSVELEYQIPEGSNSVAEVKKCVEYCKNILA